MSANQKAGNGTELRETKAALAEAALANALGSGTRAELAALYEPAPAMELVAREPVRLVPGRSVWCHGGSGALGHPRVWLNLDKQGPQPCGYCGIRYQKDDEHHGHGHDHSHDQHAAAHGASKAQQH